MVWTYERTKQRLTKRIYKEEVSRVRGRRRLRRRWKNGVKEAVWYWGLNIQKGERLWMVHYTCQLESENEQTRPLLPVFLSPHCLSGETVNMYEKFLYVIINSISIYNAFIHLLGESILQNCETLSISQADKE